MLHVHIVYIRYFVDEGLLLRRSQQFVYMDDVMTILTMFIGSVSFIDKVFKISKKRPLVEADLGKSSTAVKPKTLYQKFMVGWNKELEKSADKRSLLKAIIGATVTR